jgi:hypothetical protein
MPWCVLAESVTGTAHRARDLPCQDAFLSWTLGLQEEWLVVVVADGAGSASLSKVGAELACDEFARRIRKLEPISLSDHEVVIALFLEVREALIAEAARLGVDGRELACTALLAIIGPSSAMMAQVGDGAIIFNQGDGYQTAIWPEPAEYANATDFLIDDRLAEVVKCRAIAEPISEVALFTDGLQRLALDFTARAPFAGFFREAIDTESLQESYRAFLDSSRVNERTDDDKTLVIATRRP